MKGSDDFTNLLCAKFFELIVKILFRNNWHMLTLAVPKYIYQILVTFKISNLATSWDGVWLPPAELGQGSPGQG